MSTPDASSPDAPGHGGDELAARLHADLEHATEHAARMQTEYEEAIADPGVIQEDRDAAARALERAHHELDSARSALAHLEAGSYGRCATCGDAIGEERLAALTGVTTCVRCAG